MTRCYPCQRNHISGACPRCGRRSDRFALTDAASAEQMSRYAVGGEVSLAKSVDQHLTDLIANYRLRHQRLIDTIEAKWAHERYRGVGMSVLSTGYGRSAIWDWWQRMVERAHSVEAPQPERHPCPGCGCADEHLNINHEPGCAWKPRHLPLDGRCQSEGHDDYVGWHPGKRLDVDELSFDGPYSDGTSSYSLFLRHDGRWTCDECWETHPWAHENYSKSRLSPLSEAGSPTSTCTDCGLKFFSSRPGVCLDCRLSKGTP